MQTNDFKCFRYMYAARKVIYILYFSPPALIKIGTRNLSAKANSDKSVEISIKDSGIGMSSAMVDNLFRIDVQTNRPGTEGEASTGLGLIICKDFIEKYCGKIWVESEVGKGSIFYVTIPSNG